MTFQVSSMQTGWHITPFNNRASEAGGSAPIARTVIKRLKTREQSVLGIVTRLAIVDWYKGVTTPSNRAASCARR